MVNLGEAYRKDEQMTVRPAQADREKTNKRRTKDEQKTNNERRNSALKVKVKWS